MALACAAFPALVQTQRITGAGGTFRRVPIPFLHLLPALRLVAMITGLLSETLRNKTFHRHVIRVDRSARVAYVLIVALTVGVYLWKYSAMLV
jgi:hypothetical protein